MATLQLYFPTGKEIKELHKYAAKRGFKSTAEYMRFLYEMDREINSNINRRDEKG